MVDYRRISRCFVEWMGVVLFCHAPKLAGKEVSEVMWILGGIAVGGIVATGIILLVVSKFHYLE